MPRGKHDIVYDILMCVGLKPLSKTNILNYSGVEYSRAKPIFEDIVKAKFIIKDRDNHYLLTDAGREYVYLYTQVKRMLGNI